MSISGIDSSISIKNVNNFFSERKIMASSSDINLEVSKRNQDLNLNGIDVDLFKASMPEDDEESGKIKLAWDDNNTTGARNFETLIHNMEGLSADQKTTLENAINAASDTLSSGQRNGDTYGMRIAQTDLEFRYISQKLVPEEYQAKFNSIAEEYTKAQSDDFVNFEKYFAENLMNRTDSLSTQLGWQKEGKEIMKSIGDGSDMFQSSERNFENLYNGIDVTKSDIKEQVNNVYKNILYNGSSDKIDLSKEIKYLSEKWNGVMDALGEKDNKFTTSVNCLA